MVADPAWNAVAQRLLHAETAGWQPAPLLRLAAAVRETASADSVAEVLTWRIDTILKSTPPRPTKADLYRPGPTLPPWLPPPLPAADRSPLARYLTEAATLISARAKDLAKTAIRDRPPWLTALGQPPPTLYQRHQWQRHIAIIAAYRDQQNITTADPAPPLGLHIEPGNHSHAAYQHASRSVIIALELAAHAAGHSQAGSTRPRKGVTSLGSATPAASITERSTPVIG